MTKPTRPTVTVEPVVTETGDVSHCQITVGTATFDALFTQSSCDLREVILDATDVDLSVDEVMTVTRASRGQMEREAGRLKVILQGMPAGTIALVKEGLFFWVGAKGELLWTEWMVVGDAPEDIYPREIEDIGEIDTEEMHAVAENIRAWLQEPSTTAVDQEWLRSVEAK